MRKKTWLQSLITAGVVGLALGCDTTGPTTAPSAMTPAFKSTTVAGPQGSVAKCAVQKYASQTLRIGAQGGRLKVGKHEFRIPAGALSAPVTITMEAVADSANSVRFSPAGLVFNPLHMPDLRLSTDGCKLPKGGKGGKVAYVTEQLQVLQMLQSQGDTAAATTQAEVHHFSRYAVAY